jgi:hypothetical protein
VASACASKPKAIDPGTGLPSGKVTAQIIENRVYLEAQIAYAPRRFAEMESGILNHKGVQNCLRVAPDIREESFSVGLEGHLSYTGSIEAFRAKTPTESLRNCLTEAFKTINLQRGRMGPFKLQVVRGKPPEDDGKKPKGILLELSTLKKWE